MPLETKELFKGNRAFWDILRANPMEDKVHYNIAVAYKETKQVDRAQQHYKKVIEINRHPDLVDRANKQLNSLGP